MSEQTERLKKWEAIEFNLEYIFYEEDVQEKLNLFKELLELSKRLDDLKEIIHTVAIDSLEQKSCINELRLMVQSQAQSIVNLKEYFK